MSFRDFFAAILIGFFLPISAAGQRVDQPSAPSVDSVDASRAGTPAAEALGDEPTIENFGSFQVVRNVARAVDPPTLHELPLAKEAKLIWRSNSVAFEMAMTDDGFSVELQLSAGDGTDRPICLMGNILRPDFKPTGAKNWTTMRNGVERILKSCPAMTKSDRARIQSEMLAAADDYPAAANAWKSISRELFGPSTRRCVSTKVDRDYSFPLITCTRYSG